MKEEQLTTAPASPPRPLLVFLGLSFVLAVFPLSFMVHYTRVWWRERAGKSLSEQRDSYPNTAWLQPVFQRFVVWLDQSLPEGAALLVTPTQLAVTGPRGLPTDQLQDSGRTRWFLYLNYWLYPRAVYVRQPALASGTLVDYPEWIRYHDEVLNVDGRHVQSIEELKQRALTGQREREIFAELEQRHGQLFELEVPTVRVFRPERVRLFRLRVPEDPEQDLVREPVAVPNLPELLRTIRWGPGTPPPVPDEDDLDDTGEGE